MPKKGLETIKFLLLSVIYIDYSFACPGNVSSCQQFQNNDEKFYELSSFNTTGFQPSSTGWTVQSTEAEHCALICNNKGFFGRFGAGNWAENTFISLPAHYQYMINITVLSIDDWTENRFIIYEGSISTGNVLVSQLFSSTDPSRNVSCPNYVPGTTSNQLDEIAYLQTD
jgi:hypothetical protein